MTASAAIVVYQPPLTPLEQQEQAIAAGEKKVIEGYRDIAQALKNIQNGELYLERGYTNYMTYAQATWGYSKARVYQLLKAEKIAVSFLEAGLPIPANEKVARGLAPLNDDQRELIWTTAQKIAPNGVVTERWITALITALDEVTRTRAINVDGEAVDVSQAFTVMVTDEAWYNAQFQRGGMSGTRLYYGKAEIVGQTGGCITLKLEGTRPEVWTGDKIRVTIYSEGE